MRILMVALTAAYVCLFIVEFIPALSEKRKQWLAGCRLSAAALACLALLLSAVFFHRTPPRGNREERASGRDRLARAKGSSARPSSAGRRGANGAPASYADIYAHIRRSASRHRIDPLLVRALIRVESNFDPAAVSRRGAMGLMQITKETARELGLKDPFDVRENIEGGVRYLHSLLVRHNHSLRLALASYNAGPTSVRRHRGIPPYRETRRYVRKVLREYGKLKRRLRKTRRSRAAGL